MNKFDELKFLFDSKTIRPSFELVHVILSILLYGEYSEGLGRYRLESELLIGSGTAKSLVRRLKKFGNYIKVPKQTFEDTQEIRRKGHVLTHRGLDLLNEIKKAIPTINQTDTDFLKSIIIESKDKASYFCLVKNVVNQLGDGVLQRDAAIMIGGSGATCLAYDGVKIVFPEDYAVRERDQKIPINQDIQIYFKTKIINENALLERGDVIIIGIGNNVKLARLAALNAALTLI
ncbi:MAG: DUF4443 domain-containing protein [Candidatus Thorarchaeota archaeon]